MAEQQGLRARRVETNLYLVVLRHLVAIDAQHLTPTEHTVRDAVAGLPFGR